MLWQIKGVQLENPMASETARVEGPSQATFARAMYLLKKRIYTCQLLNNNILGRMDAEACTE